MRFVQSGIYRVLWSSTWTEKYFENMVKKKENTWVYTFLSISNCWCTHLLKYSLLYNTTLLNEPIMSTQSQYTYSTIYYFVLFAVIYISAWGREGCCRLFRFRWIDVPSMIISPLHFVYNNKVVTTLVFCIRVPDILHDHFQNIF